MIWIMATETKPDNTGKKIQLDIGSTANILPPLLPGAAQQKTQGKKNPAHPAEKLSNKMLNNAIFDNVSVKITSQNLIELDTREINFRKYTQKIIIWTII